jgi:hypothetical protein
MTPQLKPGHNLSDAEIARLADLLEANYPDQDFEIVIDDAPQRATQPGREVEFEAGPNFIQKLAVGAVTLVAGLYLFNPTSGVIEFIPDIIPVVGNLDEATALALVVSGMNFFGLNIGWLTAIFGQRKRKRDE